ncbi:MAG: hypothetical protein K0S92_1043 [Desertimonas sp.]|nr:hypothetical protein [Desertimonas sp.]
MSHEEQHGISRRDVLRTGAVAGVAAALGGAGAAAAVPATAAPASPGLPDGNGDTAFVNGRIHTMDDDERVVDAVLIRDGVFAAVGTGVPVGGPGAQFVNLQGRTGRTRAHREPRRHSMKGHGAT